MADEVHEAPIIHSRLSCSAMAVVELSRGLTITGVDTTVLDSDNLLEGKIAQQALLQNMPREFNVDISDLSTTPVVSEQNTFTGGGVSVVDGIYRVEVPSNGIYNVDVLSNNMLTAQHKVLKLGDSFAEMTDPFNFQTGSSFSVDFEWRGTTMSGVGIDVPIVSTSQFSLSCEQLSSSSYGVRLTVNDGASSIMIPADRYELHKDAWYKISIVWFAPENSLFLYINNIYVFSDTLTTFGTHTARPFTFGKNLSSGVTGGNYEFKWIRFHQSPLNAKQVRDLIAPSTTDVDGFRTAIVYTGAESSPTIPTIQKNSAVLENTPSSDYDATVSIIVGDIVGDSIDGEVVKTIVANSYADDIPLNATVLAKSGQIITMSAHNISPVSFKVYALKTDNVIIPNIVLSGSDVLLQRTQYYSDPGFSATEVDSLGNSTDRTLSVVTTGSVDDLNAGQNTIKYTLSSSDNLVSVTKIRKVTVIDTVKPIIVMRGAFTITHERGTNYNDLGADATDADVTLTTNISVHNTVNQNIVGTYTVTYNTVDSRGNAALPVVRTVNVVDTTPPVITVLTGSNGLIGQTVERLDSYTDPGATATDYPGNEDLTSSIQVSFIRNADSSVLSEVDVATVGTYTVIYQCNDSAVNNGVANVAIQKQRTVTVVDTTAPEIIVSSGDITIARESTYVDAGASAFDKKSDGTEDTDTELTSSIVTTTKAKALDGTNTWHVKVVNSDGNKYVFTADSSFTSQGYLLYPEITLTAGETYVFDQSDSSNNNHPIWFADSSGGSYSTDVSSSGTPGQAGATVTFTVPSYGYTTMKYVCQVHGAGMGNTIYVKAASDAVNTVTAQKFQMCYDVTDAQSNAATTKYRMVTVSDSTSPSISLTGGTVAIERAVGSYSEPGYSAIDDTVDLTSRVVVTHNVNTSATGDYYYNYDVTDSSGNMATRVSRLVQVRDSRPPSISVTGGSTVTVERYSTYSDAGATADDDGTPVSVTTNMGGFDKDVVDTYTITYSATDMAGNTTTATRTVTVEDNTNPIVTLQSAHENPYYIEVGTGSYTEYGATAADGNGGSPLSVVTTGTVNTNAVGTYTKYYTATDSTGRSGQASRQVIVRDTVAPTVSLIGDATVEIETGSVASYVDAGVNASDASGTVNITTDHNIDINTPGTYTFTHTVSDGTNQTQVSRTVVVIDSTPEITLLGDNPTTIEAGGTWTDPGASSATSASVSNPFPLVQGVSTSLAGPFTGPQTITVSRNLPKGTSSYSIEFTFTSTTTTPSNIMLVGWGTANSTSNKVFVTTQPLRGRSALTIGHYADDHAFTGYDYTSLFDGSAHNVRVTKDSGSPATVTLYIDGDAKGTGTVNGPINMGNTTGLLIGNSSLGEGGSMNSNHEIRDVRILDDTETTTDLMISTVGRYGITYSASSGTNTGTATRTVIVNDTVSPVFGTITNVTNHQRGTTYSDSVPTAHDPRDDGNVDLSSSVTTTSTTVNDSQVGTYSVAYSVSDGTNTTTATKSVTVVDSTQPVITLSGDGLSSGSRLTFTQNAYSNWTQLAGAVDVTFTATDDGDDVSGLVQIDVSNVLWDTPGDYDVFYDLSDPNRGPNASRRTRYLTIEAAVVEPSTSASGVPGLPVTSGLLAHYSWYSWKNTTTWEDLSGNGNHMTNVEAGTSALVTAENANMTDNNTGARFPYIAGNSSSRWDIGGLTGGERLPQNSWTYIHIHRYDPAGSDKDGRVLGAYGGSGTNGLFGTANGYVGNSHHDGWLGGHNYIGSRFNSHWVFHVERPGKYWRTTTNDSAWSGQHTGGNVNMNWRPTLNAGMYNQNCDWNVAELILFNRVLSDAEVESFKTWLMDYKAGNTHEQYTSASGPTSGDLSDGLQIEFIWRPEYLYNNEKWWPSYVHSDQQRGDSNGISNFNNGITFSTTNHDVRTDGIVLKDNGHNCTLHLNKVFQDNFKSTVGNAVSFEVWCEYTGDYTMQSGFKGWMMGLDNGYGPTICINESRVGNISCMPPGQYSHTFDSSNPYQGGNIVNYQGVLMHLIGCWKWDGSGIVESIYINGEYVQPTNNTPSLPNMSANVTSMYIGGRGNPSTGDGTCYGMKIYSARVWHKELNQSTVDLLYAAGKYDNCTSSAGAAPAATIYWWGGNYPHLTLFWNTSQRNYYNYSVYNSFDYFKSSLPSHHQTSTTGTLDIGDQSVGDQNIHIEFAAGTVSNIRIRGQTSSTAYAFWTGSQWEGQTMANGRDSTGRHNMNHNEHLVWTNNDGTYAELNIVPPSNATQLGLLNGNGRKYILVEIS
jgi:hypothetical protein